MITWVVAGYSLLTLRGGVLQSDVAQLAVRLVCRFSVREGLWLAPYAVTLPRQVHLYVRKAGAFIKVKSMEQLAQGQNILIRDSQGALQFVRLRTHPELLLPFRGEQVLEITPKGKLSELLPVEHESLATKFAKAPEGLWGVVSTDWFSRKGLRPAAVRADHSDWIVARSILRKSGKKVSAWIIKERVSRNGQYSIDSLTPLPTEGPNGKWSWIEVKE